MPRPPFDPSKMAAKREAASLFGAGSRSDSEIPAPTESSNPEPSGPTPAADVSSRTTATDRPLTVSQLCSLIDTTLRAGMPPRLRVVGEISGFNNRTHWYFNLKDADAVVSCVMFASAARAIRFVPENGHEVVATGRVEFFAKQGRTQFYVEKIDPVGTGALDIEFRRLCEELRAKGWFDPARKRPLSTFPRRIAVVTSRTSAAYQDVLNTITRRCPAVGITLLDVRVQGDGAAANIIRALRWINQRHAELNLDAVLLTRGGGSKEDLWTFNDRAVAEAVLTCAVPVVAAIGHETDTSIAELVADERCATPTQAAMRLTPDSAALTEQLDSLASRLVSTTSRHVRELRRRVEAAERSPTLAVPKRLTEPHRKKLEELTRRAARAASAATHQQALRLERTSARLEVHRPAEVFARRAAMLERAAGALQAAMHARLSKHDLDRADRRLTDAAARRAAQLAAQLDSLDRALDLVGPASVLRRGYSMTLRTDGGAVRSIANVRAGETIKTVVADGSFESTVSGARGDTPLPPDALRDAARRLEQRAARTKRKTPGGSNDQMRLF